MIHDHGGSSLTRGATDAKQLHSTTRDDSVPSIEGATSRHGIVMLNTTKAAAGRRLVSIAEAADALSVSTKTIRRYISAGTLHAERIGPRMIRVDAESLAALGRPIAWADAR